MIWYSIFTAQALIKLLYLASLLQILDKCIQQLIWKKTQFIICEK